MTNLKPNNFTHMKLDALLITLATVVLVSCSKDKASDPPPEVVMPVVIQRPTVMEVEDTVSAVGTIEANERVEIQPEVAGLIEEISFAEGDRVKTGEQLFTMDSRKEAAALAQAKAELDLAQSNLERAKTLIGTKAISQQELDQLESIVAVRSAVLKTSQERLSERTIEAPFDGKVGPRQVSPGQYVNAGTSLVTLVDDSSMKVRFRVPERQLALMKEKQRARLTIAAWPDRTFEGHVDLINPVVDPATRTAEIRLQVPNPDHLLKAGMFARVSVVVQTRPEALVIPEAALIPALDKISVYLVKDGAARLSPVQLGVHLPGKVEIREGLSPESEFVASGVQKIVDGMKVVQASPPDTASATTN